MREGCLSHHAAVWRGTPFGLCRQRREELKVKEKAGRWAIRGELRQRTAKGGSGRQRHLRSCMWRWLLDGHLHLPVAVLESVGRVSDPRRQPCE